jgi:hypothetical protein
LRRVMNKYENPKIINWSIFRFTVIYRKIFKFISFSISFFSYWLLLNNWSFKCYKKIRLKIWLNWVFICHNSKHKLYLNTFLVKTAVFVVFTQFQKIN